MKKIEFFRHNINEEDIKEVDDTLRSIFLTTAGKVSKFESKLSAYLDVPYSVGVSSCTAGLQLSLIGLGIRAGDEVITTPLSFIASSNAIEYVGARPVFIDVDIDTGLIKEDAIEKAITPKTKAILVVHLYGQMCDMKRLNKIATKHNLKLIEDAAHALESSRDGIKPGQLSDAAVFSFYATKTITSGEGGAVATRHKKLRDWMVKARLHGMSKDAASRYTEKYKHYDMEFLGFKSNMTDIAAGLLLGQLSRSEKLWSARVQIANFYDKIFANVVKKPIVLPKVRHAYYVYTILVDSKHRDDVLHELQESGIGVAINFRPIHMMSYYRNKYSFKEGDFPNAEIIGASTITIPLYPSLSSKEIKYIASKVLDLHRKHDLGNPTASGVSLFFPAYNEEGNIENVVKDALAAFQKTDIPFEIIIINDGSRDRTGQISDKLAKKYKQVRAIHHEFNKDYGLTLQTGFASARYPVVGYMDGDGQFEASDFVDKLLPKLDSADLVTGQRVDRADPLVRRINAFLWNMLAKLLFGIAVNDVDCGMKVIKKGVLNKLKVKYGYATVCQELHFKTQNAGFRTAQVPVTHKPRTIGTQTGAHPWVIVNSLLQLFQMRLELWVEKYWRGDPIETFKALPRLIRFGVVGSIGFIIQLFSLSFLVEFFQINPLLANIPAFAIATSVNFYLSIKLTWYDRMERLGLAETVAKFFLLGITNETFFALFSFQVTYQPALTLAVFASAIINLFVYNKFIFSSKASEVSSADV